MTGQNTTSGKSAFTLIELVIVMTVIGILLTIAQPTFKNAVTRAKETVLRENLYAIRNSIDQYYADNQKYPDSLDALKTAGYLRALPMDPFTNSNTTWVTVQPPNEEGGVFDVKSGSPLISISSSWSAGVISGDASGSPYSEW